MVRVRSLMEVRNEAKFLGIKNCAKYTKEELLELIQKTKKDKASLIQQQRELEKNHDKELTEELQSRKLKTYIYTPVVEKPSNMGELTGIIYDYLAKGADGLSPHHIAKKFGTYYNVVTSVVRRFFLVTTK